MKTIIPADFPDLPRILPVYERARTFMAANGNASQWGSSYPQKELLEDDIRKKQLYLLQDDTGNIAAVFVFYIGEDPNYKIIEDGCWPDERPYGVIHRVASSGLVRYAADDCIRWCLEQCRCSDASLRGDTHENNLPMQHVFERNGFSRCGIVYMADHTPRIAFQKE